MIRLHDVSKSYHLGTETVNALQAVTLAIAPAEFVAIVGSSGSGKSTLMNLLGCLDKPTRGQLWIDDNDVQEMGDAALAVLRNEKIGFVFQTFELLPRMTALKNVELPFLYTRANRKNVTAIARDALKRVGLAHRMQHLPDQLSGGQRQRVAIARAIVRSPSILLADEPTGNLDNKTTHEILELFRSLNEQGHTIVLVTHERDVAASCRRVLTLADGRLVRDEEVDNGKKER